MKKILFFILLLQVTLSFSAINLTSPSNNQKDVDISAIMTWNNTGDEQFKYSLYISETQTFDEKNPEVSALSITNYVIQNLKPNTKYFWKVIGENNNTKVESSLFTFTTRNLINGDISSVSYGDYNYLYPYKDNLVGIKNNEINIIDPNNKIMYFNYDNLSKVIVRDKVYAVTDKKIYVITEKGESKAISINDKIIDVLGENAYYSSSKLYANINNEIRTYSETSIIKVIYKNNYYYILTKDKILRLNANLEDVIFRKMLMTSNAENMEISISAGDIFILSQDALFSYDKDLNPIKSIKFYESSPKKIFANFDGIAMITAQKDFALLNSTLDYYFRKSFTDKFDYFIPLTKDKYVLAGEKILVQKKTGEKLWNYVSIYPLDIKYKPVAFEDGILVNYEDYANKFVFFYEKPDRLSYTFDIPGVVKQQEKTIPKQPEDKQTTTEATKTDDLTFKMSQNKDTLLLSGNLPKQQDQPKNTAPASDNQNIQPAVPLVKLWNPDVKIGEFIKVMPKTNDQNAYSMQVYNNKIYTAGYTSENKWDGAIWIFDANGNLKKEFIAGGKDVDYFRDLAVFKDKNETKILATGFARSIGFNGDVWIAGFSEEQGKKVMENNYGATGRDDGIRIEDLKDGYYMIFGDWFASNNDKTNIVALRYTYGNAMSWTTSFGGPNVEHACDFIKDTDGYYFLASSSSYGKGLNDVYTVKTDLTGKKIWDKAYGSQFDEIPVGIFIHNNAKYSLFESSQNGKNVHYVVGFDTNGYLDNFFFKPAENEKLYKVKAIRGNIYAVGTRFTENKKTGIIYKIDPVAKTFTELDFIQLQVNLELMDIDAIGNYFYILANVDGRGKDVAIIKRKIPE